MPVLLPAEVLGPRSKRHTDFEARILRLQNLHPVPNPSLREARLDYAHWVRPRGDEWYARALEYMALNDTYPARDGMTAPDKYPVYLWCRGEPTFNFLRALPEPLFTAVRDLLPDPPPQPPFTWAIYVRGDVLTHKIGPWLAFRSLRLGTEYLAKAMAHTDWRP